MHDVGGVDEGRERGGAQEVLEIETRDKYERCRVDERNKGELTFWHGRSGNSVEHIDVGDASGRDLCGLGNGRLSDRNDRVQPSLWAVACASYKAAQGT